MLVELDSEAFEHILFENRLLPARVSDIEDVAAGREPRTELLDHFLDQDVLPSRRQLNTAAVRQNNGNLTLGSRSRVLRTKSRQLLQILGKAQLKAIGAINGEELQRLGGDLVTVVWRVHRPFWLVRIQQDQTCIDKLVQGPSADRLAGVRFVIATVLLAQPSHQLDRAKWRVADGRPWRVRRQLQQGEEHKRRAFVGLLAIEAKQRQRLPCLGDPSLCRRFAHAAGASAPCVCCPGASPTPQTTR